MFLDDAPVLDDGQEHVAREKSAAVRFTRGKHPLRVDYFNAKGDVALQLFCKNASNLEALCPTSL